MVGKFSGHLRSKTLPGILIDHIQDPDWETKKLVFAENNGKPIEPRKIQKAFKRILAAAGLPTIRFHDLRHTAATHMLGNKVDMFTVSRRLGHTKVSTTLDIYAHAIPGTQEEAAEIRDEITALVALPADLTATLLHPVAPGTKRRKFSTLRNLSLNQKSYYFVP